MNIDSSVCNYITYPIIDFVHGYQRPDDDKDNPDDKSGGYLWTLHAWYYNAVSMVGWYYSKSADDLREILSVSDIKTDNEDFQPGATRLGDLLNASSNAANNVIARSLLAEGMQNYKVYMTWGNYAYKGTQEAVPNAPYNIAIRLWRDQDGIGFPDDEDERNNIIRFCVLNLHHPAFYGRAGEDAFVIITGNIGPTSVASDGIIPDWGKTELSNYTTSEFTNHFRQCSCLPEYPSTSRCYYNNQNP